MSDAFRHENTVLSSARTLRAVTPNDTNDLPLGVCKALHIGAGGTIAVIAADDSSSVTLTVQEGVLPVRVKRVLATGTTASSIVALY